MSKILGSPQSAPNQTIETSNSRSPSNSPITDVSSFIRSSWSITCINVLTGDNYPTWKRSMKMTLNPKTKLRFIEGSMVQPPETAQNLKVWERCNNMVLSWMLNEIEKSLTSSLIYCNTLRSHWLELEECFSQSNNP
ncbi:hypothetical protein ACOSQ4_021193 [Xanthoceras sorbifolium]